MSDERRYREDESKEIFEAAATASDSDPQALTAPKGMTLSELQEIGLEVGLAPARIADAASALELRRSALPRRTSLGMPISVGRVIDLPRAPTDREWELLVGELRATFHAQGKLGSSGTIRQWTNGRLHAYVEPTEAGYRLRMGTLKGTAPAMNLVGIAGIGVGIVMLVAGLLPGTATVAPVAPFVFGALGVAAFLSNLVRLPRWAHRREVQMEYIAARVRALLGSGPDAEP